MADIRALTVTDLRNVLRDSFLKFILLYPLILGLAMRWLVPAVAEGMAGTFDVYAYYPLILSLFGIAMAPLLLALAVGFLLLDERDERILVALQVTPLSTGSYLAYRLFVPMAVGLVSAYIVIPLMDLMPVSLLRIMPIALLAALGAPIYTLLLASLANNKVQGLALMKAMGVFIMAPVGAWFVPEPWQWLLGVAPAYWPMKATWVLVEGGVFWPYLAAGIVVNVLYLFALLRYFLRRMATLYG